MSFHEGVFPKTSSSGPLKLKEANWWNRETQNRVIYRGVLPLSIVLHIQRSLSQVTIIKGRRLRLRIYRANEWSVEKKESGGYRLSEISLHVCCLWERISRICGKSKDIKTWTCLNIFSYTYKRINYIFSLNISPIIDIRKFYEMLFINLLSIIILYLFLLITI